MKVATYNIASGGFLDYDSTAKTPERLSLLQEAIALVDADVIGLTDTFRWAEIFTAKQVQDIFDYPYSFHIDMNDTRVDKRIGVALLSRYPLATAEPVRLYNRSAIVAKIKIGGIGLFTTFLVYLDDLSEMTRQKQVQALTEHLPNDGPIAVMGDFNALWPQHAGEVKRQANTFLEANSNFKGHHDFQAIQGVLNNFYQATALSELRQHELTEPPGLRPTALTSLHTLGLPNIFPVDHILVRNCVADIYAVSSGGIFEVASDHYPLVANLS